MPGAAMFLFLFCGGHTLSGQHSLGGVRQLHVSELLSVFSRIEACLL